MPTEPSLQLGLFHPLMLLKFSLRSQLFYSSLTITSWLQKRHFCPGHIYLYTAAKTVSKTHQFDLLMQLFARLTVAITTNEKKLSLNKSPAIFILWIIFHLLCRNEVQALISPPIAPSAYLFKKLPINIHDFRLFTSLVPSSHIRHVLGTNLCVVPNNPLQKTTDNY